MRARRAALALAAVAGLAAAAAWLAAGGPDAARGRAEVSVSAALGGEGEGYARASAPRPLQFPRDQGPHPDYRSEWWYFTGNLRDAAGREFGFELTFFRFALAPPPAAAGRSSAWATRQLYMAHLALTDVGAGRFHSAQRLQRGALDLAGARARPFRVWVADWSARSDPAATGTFPLRLQAAAGDWGIDLRLRAGKPRVLHGERGLSRKSAAPGNASYYYSRTRMPVRGTVRSGAASHAVQGLAWLDREWSTSALAADQRGWDWFALQLGDGWDLMYYRLRRPDGGTHPYSAGTLVAPDGASRGLAAREVQLEAQGSWRSPRDGTRYPARWRLRVPSEDLVLEVAPRLADQELNLSVRYWEGAVHARGTHRGRAVSGEGYVELTGYGPAGAPGAE